MKKTAVLCVLTALSLVACESRKEKIKEETTPVPTELKPAEVAKEATDKIPGAGDDADKAAQPAPSAMEKDTSATDTVVKKAWSTTLPEGFDLKGTVVYYASWTDKNGLNGLGVTKLKNQKGGGMIVAKHATLEGDGSWKEVRGMKELQEACEFDLVQTVFMDKNWSLTDLDSDGIGEASLAWTSDCTSDVSPNTHKVFILEGGEKYAMRGVTAVKDGKGVMGGTFKADDALAKAPAPFMAHAKTVWETTSGVK